MSDIERPSSPENENLLNKIQSLEKRLSHVESLLSLEYVDGANEPVMASKDEEHDAVESTESRIVEYGLAWLGIIVFLFGIVFLMSYIESLDYKVLSVVIAYFSVSLLILSSFLLRNSFPILVNVLNICNPLLLYYVTLKLHFFTGQPLIEQKGIAIGLLLIIVGLQLYNALRKNSEFLGIIAITLSISTAIVSDSAYITFAILTATAIGAYLLLLQIVVAIDHICFMHSLPDSFIMVAQQPYDGSSDGHR